MVEVQSREEKLRLGKQSERRYQHLQHRRCVPRDFRRHHLRLPHAGLRILVLSISRKSKRITKRYVRQTEIHQVNQADKIQLTSRSDS